MSWRGLTFAARASVPWSAPAWKRTVSREVALAALSDAGRARVAELEAAGADLSAWPRLCTLQDWRESLYVLDVVRSAMPPAGALPPGRALDVGSKNGTYLPGLAAALPRGWDAVEVDAHRRYLWGATRRAYGEAMAAGLPDARFYAADVRVLPGPWAAVTWFLPFLTPAPLEAWGLPDDLLAPEALLRHVVDRLVPGGVLLLVNQGEREAAIQRELLDRVGVRYEALGPITSALSPFQRERFGYRVGG